MIFNSFTYVVFLIVFVLLFARLGMNGRRLVIFAFSATFYAFWRPEFLLLLLFQTGVDFAAGLGIGAAKGRPRRRLAWLLASLAVNFSVLAWFKYAYFIADNAALVLSGLGMSLSAAPLAIVLPLGISFYTFQSVSYTIDVYRGEIQPERDLLAYMNFVLFFPQLVAGPIVRAGELLSQLERPTGGTAEDLAEGTKRILLGLFLKVCLADSVAPMVDDGFAVPAATLAAIDTWTLAGLFGLQIYFDFAGYSHIAIGSARLVGIRLPENFNFPYAASSPRDFWRRWHISLSTWVRDYLYLPLCKVRGGRHTHGEAAPEPGRVSRLRRNGALVFSWALMGLWHGAAWTFVLWGLWHAALVLGYRLLAPVTAHLPAAIRSIGGWLVTLPLVLLGWIAFRAADVPTALALWAKVVDPGAYGASALPSRHLLAAFLLAAGCLAVGLCWNRWLVKASRAGLAWKAAEAAFFAAIVALDFIYLRPIHQFIYFQF